MRKGLSLTFFLGLLIGGMAALIIWYYQKSTSAEDGALLLLDRLAEADRRLRQLVGQSPVPEAAERERRIVHPPATKEAPPFLQRAAVAEDLTRVRGIGPVYADRLTAVGIQTVAQITAMTPARLADVLQISESRAESILAAANEALE